MSDRKSFTFTGTIWVWQARSGEKPVCWFFVTVEGQTAAEIKLAALGLTAGFGSLPVRATIGVTTWRTSIFPHREAGGWILPLKAAVRKSTDVGEGDAIEVTLEI